MSRKYRASVLMTFIALVFLVLHGWTGWEAFLDESASQGQKAEWSAYAMVWARDTVENLQSEFWQLAVQFALLAGAFRFIRVEAYEDDIEKLNEQLRRIESKLDGQHTVPRHTDMPPSA